jgi:hypothetical protein
MPFRQEFEPEMLLVMIKALEIACVAQPSVSREIIATRIVSAARFGEIELVRLLEAAVETH